MVSSSVVLFVLRLKVESSICHAHDIKVFRRGYLKEILHEMMMQDFSSGDNVADFLFGFKKPATSYWQRDVAFNVALCTSSYTISICLVGFKNHLKDGSFDLFFWKIHCLETKVKCFGEGVYASYLSFRRILFMKSFCEARLIYSRKKFDYYFLDFSPYLIKTIKRTGHVRKRTPV